VAVAACFLSATLARRGRLHEADTAAARALRAARDGWRAGVPVAAAFRCAILLERGELEAAHELIEEHGVGAAIPGSAGASLARYVRGRVRTALGRLEEGLDDLLAAVGEQPVPIVRGAAVGAWHADAAVALARLERLDDARRTAREGLDLARAFGTPSAIGAALRTAARVGVDDGDAGLPLASEAVTVLRASPARVELARAYVDLGAALRRRNRRAAARRELRAGLELAERCGATLLARRAQRELQATGSRPRRPLRKGLEALTASELRVAELAAQGRSNRDIAQELVVTVKTVEWHLGQTYRKLDVRSRRELPGVLGQAANAGGDARVDPDAKAAGPP
jgi:DNA-binding CsgD family transcriptional regulator